jgi:quinol monooxygenase YgiN
MLMSVTVIVRAKLKSDRNSVRKLHDEVTAATKEMARGAGDVSHQTFLNPNDPRDFLGIDVWKSSEAFQKFSSDPKIQQFFGQMFEGRPDVTVWEDSGWNKW